jgi:pimeloyl-ACP methyl ester carboxylesterase
MGKRDMIFKRILVLFFCLSLTGCAYIQPPRNSLRTIQYSNGNQKAEILFILLPGMGSRADDFLKHGFIRQLQTSGVKADAILVDAYLGYYLKRNIIVRLQEDVILPARERGYENIWMMGISMGGFGTILYAKEHPGVLKGMILLAPFLGEEEIIEEIQEAGGLLKWTPKVPLTDENYQEVIWDWLKAYSRPDNNLPRLLLGFGREDSFFAANSLLGDVLPQGQVYLQTGRHDWQTWNRIFYSMLTDHFGQPAKK